MSLESKLRNIFLIGMSSLALSCGGDKSTGPITPSAAQNNAPTVTSISPKEVQERFDYSAKIIAADADGDDLTFSLVEKPDWLSISGNNLSGLAPEVQRDSTFSFKVRVSDGKSSGELSDSVTVKNISNTYVVTEESPERIMSVGENQITFLGVPNFEEGDIVASGITEETPYGLLRKVTSVSGNVVYTEQGTLEEAVKHGSFHFTGRITPDMVNQKAARKGVSFFQTPLFDIGMNLDEMLEEGEFGQTEINGSVGLSIGYDLEADFEKRKLKEFLFTLTATGKYDLNVISPAIPGINHKVSFDNLVPILPFTIGFIPLGPILIPVTVHPVVGVDVGINGSLGELETGISQEASFTAGLKYENGNWSPISEFKNEFDFDSPKIKTKDFNFRAFVGPSLNFPVYKVAGPYGSLPGFIGLEANQERWSSSLGLEAVLGVNMKVFRLLIIQKVLIFIIRLLPRGSLLLGGLILLGIAATV